MYTNKIFFIEYKYALGNRTGGGDVTLVRMDCIVGEKSMRQSEKYIAAGGGRNTLG